MNFMIFLDRKTFEKLDFSSLYEIFLIGFFIWRCNNNG